MKDYTQTTGLFLLFPVLSSLFHLAPCLSLCLIRKHSTHTLGDKEMLKNASELFIIVTETLKYKNSRLNEKRKDILRMVQLVKMQ